jgi:hypothetical protein
MMISGRRQMRISGRRQMRISGRRQEDIRWETSGYQVGHI